MKSLIIGAGFAGLAAGIKTNLPIYEAANRPGGICVEYEKDGFTFSVGGPHWVFGSGPGLDFIKTLSALNTYERRASVYYNCHFPYPIQTFAQKKSLSKQGTFKWWAHEKFGDELCNMFFDPFNESYTAGFYSSIVQDDEKKTPPAGDKGHVPVFHDPVEGLNTVVRKMADQCDIRYNRRAIAINTEKKHVIFEAGDSVERVPYEKIISTMPLGMCLALCGKKDFDLPFTSVFVLNIGAEPGKFCPTDHWVYTPFSKAGFYRLGFSSNANPKKAPEGKVCLSVEKALKMGETFDPEKLAFDMISELQDWHFIGKIIASDVTFVPCAYTWLRDKEQRDKHIQWLKDRDIISIGRYGAHKFCGMVDSIKDGLEVKI